jgi:uncharacterized protein
MGVCDLLVKSFPKLSHTKVTLSNRVNDIQKLCKSAKLCQISLEMILRYSAKNFFSFRDKVEIDFTVGLQAGNRPGVAQSDQGNRVNVVLGVLGANASGKTNLLKPLGFLSWFALESARSKPGDPILYESFAFQSVPSDALTVLELEFEFGGGIYRYEVELLGSLVHREALYRKKARFSFIFERVFNSDSGDYDFKAQDIGSSSSVPLRKNASWLSSALLQEHELALRLRPFFESIDGNLDLHGRVPTHDAEIVNLLDVADYYEQSPASLARASSLMADFDLGLAEVVVQRAKTLGPDGKEREMTFPVGVHRVDDREYCRVLMQESRGTQALFVLLRYLLPVLDSGGIACIDEFESGLHPHMAKAVVDIFFNPATNPNNAQLIATFHSDFLLRDTLHKYQIYLVEKGPDLNSQAYRLDSLRGVRNVDNLHEKYHAGAFGGIPSLP